MNRPDEPDIAVCAVCEKLIVDHDIVRYRPNRWSAYCWPCFKQKFLTNLTRLQEENNEPGRLHPGK